MIYLYRTKDDANKGFTRWIYHNMISMTYYAGDDIRILLDGDISLRLTSQELESKIHKENMNTRYNLIGKFNSFDEMCTYIKNTYPDELI